MKKEDLWCAMIRAEHRAQVHKQVAYESIRAAIQARKKWLRECQRELDALTPKHGRRYDAWPRPMSEE